MLGAAVKIFPQDAPHRAPSPRDSPETLPNIAVDWPVGMIMAPVKGLGINDYLVLPIHERLTIVVRMNGEFPGPG